MRLCHSLDMRFDRIGSGLILQATCCAPRCDRMYARFLPRKVRTQAAGQHFATAYDWGSLLSMRQLVNEMRCLDAGFCENCQAGKRLTECQGAKATA